MATYSNGEATTHSILAASRRLFYKNGYTDTYCKDIADDAGVNVGLIHYHFKSKRKLAFNVYADFLENSRSRVSELFPNEEDSIRHAIEIIIYWRILESSENFRRFMCEIIPERIPMEVAGFTGIDYFASIGKNGKNQLSREKLELLCSCDFAAENEMILHYAADPALFTADYMAELDIAMMFDLLSLPHDWTMQVLRRAQQLASSLVVKVAPDLSIDIEKA